MSCRSNLDVLRAENHVIGQVSVRVAAQVVQASGVGVPPACVAARRSQRDDGDAPSAGIQGKTCRRGMLCIDFDRVVAIAGVDADQGGQGIAWSTFDQYGVTAAARGDG